MTGRAATHIPPAPDLMPEIGHNLAATLRWAADRYGERSALEFERGEAFTFAGLASRAAGLAEELQARGVRENDVLAVALDNRATFPLLVFAAAQLGALVLPLNPSFRPAELEAIYDVAQPTHAVALAEFCERHARLHHERGMAVLAVDEAAAGHDVLRERDADWDHLGRRDLGERAVWFGLTSGSTGLPKLVAKRQRTWILVGHIMRAICGLEPDDRMLCAQPCYYGDPFFILMGTLQAGATAVMLSRFRSPTFMEHVARRSITKFWSIGAMPTMLLNTAPGPFDRRHGARAAWSVGIPRNRHRELEERFGVRWLEVYGSAEATGVLAETEHSPHVPGEGWLGRIVPTQEVRLVDQAERELTGDAAGVLQVRGPLVATEYHGRPDASAAAFRADGWYHSGDVIERCGDRWRYVRREKDVVRRAGENISCQEVEAVLRAHPGVVDAAVLPKPDPIRQEEVWAFVQRSDGLPADPASTARDVLQFAAERLAPHKLRGSCRSSATSLGRRLSGSRSVTSPPWRSSRRSISPRIGPRDGTRAAPEPHAGSPPADGRRWHRGRVMNKTATPKGHASESAAPRRSPPAERRLVEAAIKLFARRGFAAVGIREIAKEADLTIGALYHYMDSKEALLTTIMRDGLSEAAEAMEAIAAQGGSPAQQLFRLVTAHVVRQVQDADRWVTVERELFSLAPDSRTEIIALRDRYERVWEGVVRAGARDQSFTVPDVGIARLALVEMCNSVSDWYRPEGRFDLATVATMFGQMALGLVRYDGPAPPVGGAVAESAGSA